MSEERDAYLRAVFALSKSNPAAWSDFVIAFKDYTGYELERMAGSPTGEVQISTGMARRMLELRNDFINIEKIAAKYK